MTFAGVGAGINELTALAATSEMAPTSQRGKYVAILVFTIIPFCPSVLWGQLIASHSTWVRSTQPLYPEGMLTHYQRYVSLFAGLWAFIGLVLTIIFYHPPPRVNSEGLTRSEILRQIDYVGGFLSIGGMLLFMMGMQFGGYQYSWHSAHVLAPLILGLALIVAFIVWELYGTKYPMFPRRILQVPNIMIGTLVITFISGANFFSICGFLPSASSESNEAYTQ